MSTEPRPDVVAESAAYVNANLIGKTIASAELHPDDAGYARAMRIWFTDGSAVQIMSEWDEGWKFRADEP